MGAQHPAGSNGMKVAYSGLERVTCQASLTGDGYIQSDNEQAPFTRLVPFRFEDEEVMFQSKGESGMSNGIRLLGFGCWWLLSACF